MNPLFDLKITPDAARRCADAAQRFADDLVNLEDHVSLMGSLGGFGTLPSGLALARKYSELAVGGPGSLSTLLQAHIAIASSLADTFTEMGRNYESTDSEAAQRITPK
ncbi:hypothetical protein [Rhodococcus sp. SORGH_AS_0303]|uniref:hypothetical protein n=1 Tax=Rhodococcus sp. SORGH_AS_0303 TaxID=3041753 RepID=UPI0027804B16|nr:hypothetical protein [Rhodococcus sp. SORGH_AS_0303]MDQ1200420.1 hypothetical protein [Rhodococcus sp. SORGH_AS_0303]